ncbi:MAG TPA: hypothetical protein VER32_14350 [Pyrinomonadaceae bacterium]|nr:hypothetical protein [Pyrinomonadaceae bacterium]
MSQTFKVSIESPQSGFVSVRLEGGGGRLVAAFSCEPYDSLRDLADSLASLLAGADGALVKWNAEPDEYDFRVEARGGSADFEVVRYANHRRRGGRVVFSVNCPRLELCRAFWRELRELRRRSDTDAFAQNWRHAFPDEELRRLTKALREHKRKSVA